MEAEEVHARVDEPEAEIAQPGIVLLGPDPELGGEQPGPDAARRRDEAPGGGGILHPRHAPAGPADVGRRAAEVDVGSHHLQPGAALERLDEALAFHGVELKHGTLGLGLGIEVPALVGRAGHEGSSAGHLGAGEVEAAELAYHGSEGTMAQFDHRRQKETAGREGAFHPFESTPDGGLRRYRVVAAMARAQGDAH